MAKKTLTLHLAKPDVGGFNDVLSDGARARLARPTTRIVDAPAFGEGARLFVFVGDEATPPWLRDLGRHFAVPGPIQNSSSCAVLVFLKNDRFFVSTFAHGWMYLDEDNLEGDFGLRVSLNALDERKLNRLERANLGDALRGVSQSPFQRELLSFGLDDSLDLIRRLSGRTKEEASADSMSGARSLKISGEFGIADLPDLAAEALEFYGSDDYRNSSFKIIDFVSPVADRRLAATLDDETVESIKAGRNEFELGLPSGYGDDSVTYRFLGPGLRGRFPDLLLNHYVEALGNKLATLDSETLRKHQVVAVYDDDAPPRKWSIRSGLVGSLNHENGRYAINEGEWYRLDEAFRGSIEENFGELQEEWDAPPTPLRKIYDEEGGRYQTEASYNQEWAEASGFVLLDTYEVTIPGIQRSGFEPCDLLDIEGKRFIHVKKSSRRSNILSHFFKQGSNSAQQFSRFPAAWEQLLILVRARVGNNARNALRAAIDDADRKWKVLFVIADAPRAAGGFNIPFFSKISLRDETINLKAMSYDVGLRFIGLDPDPIR
jgi:uncharacterized protein (TIGR04141 family)